MPISNVIAPAEMSSLPKEYRQRRRESEPRTIPHTHSAHTLGSQMLTSVAPERLWGGALPWGVFALCNRVVDFCTDQADGTDDKGGTDSGGSVFGEAQHDFEQGEPGMAVRGDVLQATVDSFAERLDTGMEVRFVTSLKAYLIMKGSSTISIGSICSGSDVVHHVYTALANTLLAKYDIAIKVENLFQCEKDVDKQEHC